MYKFLLIPAAAVALSATSLKSPKAGAVSGDWPTFRDKAMGVVTSHPIVQGNAFTEWFAEGGASEAQQRDLVQQFSVFSQLFLIAQLSKIINAPSLEEMREGKEILANEIGVIFNNKKDKSTGGEELLSCEGTVEGGIFRHRAAHFEWLARPAASAPAESAPRHPLLSSRWTSPSPSASGSTTSASAASAPRRRSTSATS